MSPARTIVAAALTVLLLAAAAYCTRQGVVTDTWPAFLPDADSTSITRYRGPWLSAAAVALLGAGASLLAVIRSVRDRRAVRDNSAVVVAVSA